MWAFDVGDNVGVQHGSHFNIVKHIWTYIKANQLQNPRKSRVYLLDTHFDRLFAEKKNIIDCDDNLRAVFGKDQG
jgi:chromatin remodeling complex protein RSC6